MRALVWVVLLGLLLAALAACSPSPPTPLGDSVLVPTAQLALSPAVETASTAPPPTATNLPAAAPTATELTPIFPGYQACLPEPLTLPGHFWLDWPIGPSDNRAVDKSYRYGWTANDTLEVHAGVEIPNAKGTPVLAAADGVVVVAGQDDQQRFGPYLGFYGNLVIVQHDLPDSDVPLYSLYGHLSEVWTTVGAEIKAGEMIGAVGLSGVAVGSHLHFEVRYGHNDYLATRNPELWLRPLADSGVLAGYLLDADGRRLLVESLVLEHLAGPDEDPQRTQYLETYGGPMASGDDLWGEHFAIGALPPGRYLVTFVNGRIFEIEIEIEPGQLTLFSVCRSSE